MKKIYYISSLIILLFASYVNGQVVIGNGLTISKGTTLSIKNQDVIIFTNEIKGEGEIIVNNDLPHEHDILISKKFNSRISINTNSEINGLNNLSKSFIANNIHSVLPNKIEREKDALQADELPVKYVNYEGKSFKIDDVENNSCVERNYEVGVSDFSIPLILVDTLQIKAASFQIDYNIPIYSFLLNNVRFSDYAELYEFEYLTALLRPPIV